MKEVKVKKRRKYFIWQIKSIGSALLKGQPRIILFFKSAVKPSTMATFGTPKEWPLYIDRWLLCKYFFFFKYFF
jgi:hypothetical protein